MSIARGSITSGGITNGGILAGGILASQTESPYRDYSLYLDDTLDRVSNRSLSCLIPGTRYDLVNGVQTAFTTNTLVKTEKGVRTVGAYQNLFAYSNDFSQWIPSSNVVITVGDIDNNIRPGTNTYKYSLIANTLRILRSKNNILGNFNGKTLTLSFWVYPIVDTSIVVIIGSNLGDFQRIAVVTAGLWQKISYTYTFVASTTYIRPALYDTSGSIGDRFYISDAQFTESKYVLPEIPTTTTAAASVSESGTVVAGEATNGIFADEIASNFALLALALQSNQGTLTFNWTPGYSAADVAGSLNIISFDGSIDNIRYNKTTEAIELYDGTNTASKAITPVANTTYTIQCTWQGTSMQVCVDGTAGTTAIFDGSFNPGSDLVLGLSNPELQYIKNLRVLKEPQWV